MLRSNEKPLLERLEEGPSSYSLGFRRSAFAAGAASAAALGRSLVLLGSFGDTRRIFALSLLDRLEAGRNRLTQEVGRRETVAVDMPITVAVPAAPFAPALAIAFALAIAVPAPITSPCATATSIGPCAAFAAAGSTIVSRTRSRPATTSYSP